MIARALTGSRMCEIFLICVARVRQVRVNRTLTAVDKDRQIRQLREEVAKLTARIACECRRGRCMGV